MYRRIHQRGFTVMELLVCVAIAATLSALAFPKFSDLRGQLTASEDAKNLAENLAQLRGEAIRLRTAVRVTFSTTGFSWNIDDDSTVEGSFVLRSRSKWSGSTPTPIVFNGLGLIRGIPSQQVISIKNNGRIVSLTLNRNGHIKL